MHLVICDSKNLHLINHFKLNPEKFRLLIFGPRKSEYYQVCKNIRFIKNTNEICKNLNSAKTVTILEHISFLDPKCLYQIHDGSFFGSNIFGDDELYIMQVMGFAPDELNGTWHDEYINFSNLSQSDIRYEFLERFLYEKDKNKFNFNKYKTIQLRKVLITNSTNKLKHAVKNTKTLLDVIQNFKNKFDPFISSKFWYLDYSEENDDISNRLYKHFKH